MATQAATPTTATQAAATAAVKAQGALALAVGKDPAVPLNAGHANKIKAKPGQHYKLVRETANPAVKDAADNVIATQQGDDLLLRYEDGTTVTFEGFYGTCKDASICSVNLPGDTAEGYTLSGASARGVAVGEGGTLVYAHGSQNVLMEMAQGQTALSAALTALGDAPVATYLPAGLESGAGSSFNPLWLGLLGLGAAAGGGGSSSLAQPVTPGSDPVVPPTTIPDPIITTTTISGNIDAGAVKAGNGLRVSAYQADGTLLASDVAVDASGHYTLTYTSAYTGAVLLKVTDTSTGDDYLDEATKAGKDLNTDLYAVVSVGAAGQSVTANITPLTDLAAKKIGLTLDSISGDASASHVSSVNNAIAKFFGLTSGSEQIIELLATPVLDAAGTPQASNLYGKLLASISGAELQKGQTTGEVLATLVAGMTVSGTTVSFSNDAAGMAAKSLLQDGVSRALQSGVITADDAKTVLTTLMLDGSIASPQVFVYADKVNFKAGDTSTVYFKLSAASTNFDAAAITVTGGALGPLTQDGTDPTLYSATFTPDVVSDLSATATVSVGAAAFTNSVGAANIASPALALTGDTQLPTVVVTHDQTGATSGDITYTFTFSEAVTGFTAADVTVANGTQGTFTAVSATSYTLVVTPAAGFDGNVMVDVAASAAQDTIGNNSTVAVQSVQAVDTLAPTVVVTNDQTGTAGGDIIYTFTFSEAVTGFDAADVTVTKGTKGAFAGSGTSYTLVVTPTADYVGNVTVDVAAGAAVDATSNNNAAATQSVQAVDMSAPSVVITDSEAGASNIASGDITYTFTFSTAVTGFVIDDVSVVNGTKGLFTVIDPSLNISPI